uniref:CZB domain-containing protein n=1 Tax=Campylobacter hyointestinalis TaxID=198 RepID=UPI0035A2C3DD
MFSQSEEVENISIKSNEHIQEFIGKFGDLVKSSKFIECSSTIIATDIFVSLAKLDHVIFKIIGYGHVLTKDYESMSDHLNCRLGKWYAGAGKEAFGTTPQYAKLIEPHKHVHESINKAIDLSKNHSSHDKVIEQFNKAEEESLKLFNIFNEMVETKTCSMG